MIIVEGFDCSGKSTIATEIARLKGWPVVHTGGPTQDVADVIRCLHRSRVRMTQNVVQDRITHISEAAYSGLYDAKRAGWAFAHLHEIAPPCCIVYCRPPTSVMIDALAQHKAKEYDTPEHMNRVIATSESIIALYDTIMEVVKQRNTIILYDRTQGPHAFESAIRAAVSWHK